MSWSIDFQAVFSIPPPDPIPLYPFPPPAMLFDKPGINSEVTRRLHYPTDHDELIQLVAATPLVSAPGQDEVSPGVCLSPSPTAS